MHLALEALGLQAGDVVLTSPLTVAATAEVVRYFVARPAFVDVMSLHGISHDARKRYTAEGSWYYEIVAPGFKYNLTNVAAAMGPAQLRKVERLWVRWQ